MVMTMSPHSKRYYKNQIRSAKMSWTEMSHIQRAALFLIDDLIGVVTDLIWSMLPTKNNHVTSIHKHEVVTTDHLLISSGINKTHYQCHLQEGPKWSYIMKHLVQPRYDFEENRKKKRGNHTIFGPVQMLGGLPYKLPYKVPVKLPSLDKRSDNELGIWRNSMYNAIFLKP